jgi:hypothetical protein
VSTYEWLGVRCTRYRPLGKVSFVERVPSFHVADVPAIVPAGHMLLGRAFLRHSWLFSRTLLLCILELRRFLHSMTLLEVLCSAHLKTVFVDSTIRLAGNLVVLRWYEERHCSKNCGL